ncbi:MAG: 3-hydroxyacyl-CoA dehydrogenase NAD-binding domain-containing protein, partial [bacterium]|nr:3-hydroxyacyl-CoA dehydrogenase NAD-binding domain-containing protein [bacterium]
MFSTVAVVGAGTMGQGIAQLLVEAGLTVRLYDHAPQALDRAMAAITARLQRRLDSGTQAATAAGALLAAGSMAQLADAELAIEAVPEDLGLKQA